MLNTVTLKKYAKSVHAYFTDLRDVTIETVYGVVQQFSNASFRNLFLYELWTYLSLLGLYGTVLAITRYNDIRIEGIEPNIADGIVTLVRQITFIVLIPLSVVAVIPLRVSLNVNKLSLPSLFIQFLILAVSGCSIYLKERVPLLSLILHSFILKPLLNATYFYIITDVFQSYNYLFTGAMILLMGTSSQMCASFTKSISIAMFNLIGFDIRLILLATSICTVLSLSLQFITPTTGVFKPATDKLKLKDVFSYSLTKKLINTRATLCLVMYTTIFTLMNEVYSQLRRDGIILKTIKFAPLLHGRLYTVKNIKIEPIEHSFVTNMGRRVSDMFISRFGTTVNDKVYAVTTTMSVHRLAPSSINADFIHYKEAALENTISQFIQLAILSLIGLCCINQYFTPLLGYAYVSIPLLNMINVWFNSSDLLMLYYMFSAIDLGAKKALKDYPYSVLDFETKNTTRLYNEYLTQTIARLVGSALAMSLRYMIIPSTGFALRNTFAFGLINTLLNLTWVITSLVQWYIVNTTEKTRKITIF